MQIYTLKDSIGEAVRTFNVFSDAPPNLVPIGISAIDSRIGGLFAGSAGILAAATGAGKSSVALSASIASGVPTGIISTEDTPDVVGSRILAYETGIDSLDIRRKRFSPGDLRKIRAAEDAPRSGHAVHLTYPIGGSLEECLECLEALAGAGCRLVWLDYLQKIRGFKEDRRNEVSGVYTAMQRMAHKLGVALMVVSQFSRQPDPSRPPQIWHLKESGDLENEARLILLAARTDGVLTVRVAKSTFGGEGVSATFRRDSSGTLREVLNEEDDL